MDKKLVLLGIDGADWNILTPLIKEGCLPNFKHILENGSHARLRSTIPHTTAPAWTSIFTGVNPGKHGIFYFFEWKDGNRKIINSDDNQVPYLWELTDAHKTIAFNIPVTRHPRESKNNIFVSGFPSSSRGFAKPDQIEKEILDVFPGYSVGVNLNVADEKVDKEAMFLQIIENLEKKKQVATYLLENKSWNVASVVFSASDWLQHISIHEFFNETIKSKSHVGKIYKSIDEFLGYLVKKDYDILIVSDHGFLEVKRKFFVNTFLMRNGFLTEKKRPLINLFIEKMGITRQLLHTWPLKPIARVLRKSKSIVKNSEKLLRAYDELNEIDMTNTSSFAFAACGSVIVSPEQSIEEIIKLFEDCKDENERSLVKAIVRREDIYQGRAVELSPQLILMPEEDVKFCTRLSSVISKNIDSKLEKNGAHREFGIFLSYGKNFTKKGKLDDLSVMDITPTILSYLSYSIPKYMDGKPIPIINGPEQTRDTFKSQTKLAVKQFLKKKRKKNQSK